ncbi:MAG TPA: ROK family protein [Kiritimatiellia bacterium]|nr:ROK family protein [Kiritimatiellia bacterium]
MSKRARKAWVGFDLGGTKMMAVVFDQQFKVLATAKAKTPVNEGAKAVLTQIRLTIREALHAAKIAPRALSGIGVGCPGVLDLDTGVILEAPNLAWRRVPLRRLLGRWFRCRVVLANDVDAGTYGEYRFGAGQNARTLLGVFPGTGIGGGCVYEGKLLRGKKGSAMEIGHIPVRENSRLCGCGKRGCLEALAGRLAISAEVAQAAYRGEAPYIATHAGSDLKKMKSGLLAKAIKAGDAVVARILGDAMRLLGRTIGGVVNLLAPDVIVLGGGLVEAMPQLVLKEVKAGVQETAMSSFTRQLNVRIAKLGDNATALGAAALAAAAR